LSVTDISHGTVTQGVITFFVYEYKTMTVKWNEVRAIGCVNTE